MIKIAQFGNVPLNTRDIAADCLHGLIEFLFATARDEDIGALSDKKLCRNQSNSLGAASDESDLTFESLAHCPFSVVSGCSESGEAFRVSPRSFRRPPLRMPR